MSSLSNRDFRILWLGTTGAFLAMQMEMVVQGYISYLIGNSAVAVGAVAMSWGITLLPFTFVGGAIADRVDKRTLILVTQSLSAISALAVAILVVTGHIQLWHLMVAGAAKGIVFAFNMPARQALIPDLVGRSQLNNAIAVIAIGNNLSRVAGPALAGFFLGISAVGPGGTYFVLTGVLLLVVLTCLRLPSFPPGDGQHQEPLVASIATGFRFLRNSRFLMVTLAMAFIPITLGMPYQSLLPVFNEEVLAEGVQVLGLLYTAVGVGAVVGSTAVAALKNAEGRFALQLVFGALFGITLALFALTSDYRISLVLLFLTGVCNQGFLTLNNTVIMANTPREFYGRIMSIYQLTWAVMPVGTFPISALADAVGISFALASAGSLIAVLMLGVAVVNPHRSRR